MSRTGLNERMRKFVAEYRGDGDGARAARAAGYQGNDKAISVQVARLLKHDGVRAAIDAKRRAEAAARAERDAALAVGWTTTSRLGALRAIAEDPNASPLDRVRAIRLASEITGDVGRNRLDPAPAPAAPGTSSSSSDDDDFGDPGVHVPDRLLQLRRTDG